jgi:hypothetical protein
MMLALLLVYVNLIIFIVYYMSLVPDNAVSCLFNEGNFRKT